VSTRRSREAHEIAEQIEEHAEPHAHAAPTTTGSAESPAIYVGVTAMLLAIAALGGPRRPRKC